MGPLFRPKPSSALVLPILVSFLIAPFGICLADGITTPGCPRCSVCQICSIPKSEPHDCCGGGVCVEDDRDPACRYPSPHVVLAAQIVLGAALVVAMAALVSVILRMCTRNTAGARSRRQTQRSVTSLEAFVAQRLHDCPPQYDEISWDKPPSYSTLPAALEAQTNEREGPATASPPPENNSSGAVFTVSQAAEQLRTEGCSSPVQSHADTTPTI